MPSIISGYEYDIFISYRHNDNRSGWVTEFVNALQEELAATIKEPLSIYFDKNPHDGLLETHNVDKTLEGKLKCLIFIPIISQTYCDTKSFAWQHEFVAFNKLMKEDKFGRDIKLSNGNVASRILPVKIHDLDDEDKASIESEIGGTLRAIEFTFKAMGVNRSLQAHEEHPQDNQNKIFYRDQINKVAHAVKEIISSIRGPQQNLVTDKSKNPNFRSTKPKNKTRILIAASVILAMALVSIYWFVDLPSEAHGEKTIIVLPFQNLSGDAQQEYLSDGISEELHNMLSKMQGLKVIGRTTAFSFKGKEKDLKVIQKTLGAGFVLDGSVRKDRDSVRVSAYLIRIEDNTQLWTETYGRKMDGIFKLQDEIATAVVDALRVKLSPEEKLKVEKKPTRSSKAYDLYLQGTFEYHKYTPDGAQNGLRLFSEALRIDSAFSYAYSGTADAIIASAAIFIGEREALDALELAKPYLEKALRLDPNNVDAHTFTGFYYLYHDWDFEKAETEYKEAIRLDLTNSDATSIYADYLNFTLRHDEALHYSEEQLRYDYLYFNPRKSLTLYYLNRSPESLDFLKSRMSSINAYWTYDSYGFVCLNTSQYEDAINSFNQAMKIIGRRTPRMLGWMGAAYAKKGEKDKAFTILNELLDKRKTTNAGSVNFFIAVLYSALGKQEEAMHWLEKAIDDHDMEIPWLISEPQFNNLHTLPRFIELAQSVGFPNASIEKLKSR